MNGNTYMPSLLPYLGDTGAHPHLKISLASPDSSHLEKVSFPFLQIKFSDPFNRLIPAQFVTDAGSEIRRVILLVQKDEYSLSDKTNFVYPIKPNKYLKALANLLS